MSTSRTNVGKKCLSAFTLEMKRKLKYLKNKMGIADPWRYSKYHDLTWLNQFQSQAFLLREKYSSKTILSYFQTVTSKLHLEWLVWLRNLLYSWNFFNFKSLRFLLHQFYCVWENAYCLCCFFVDAVQLSGIRHHLGLADLQPRFHAKALNPACCG